MWLCSQLFNLFVVSLKIPSTGNNKPNTTEYTFEIYHKHIYSWFGIVGAGGRPFYSFPGHILYGICLFGVNLCVVVILILHIDTTKQFVWMDCMEDAIAFSDFHCIWSITLIEYVSLKWWYSSWIPTYCTIWMKSNAIGVKKNISQFLSDKHTKMCTSQNRKKRSHSAKANTIFVFLCRFVEWSIVDRIIFFLLAFFYSIFRRCVM